MPKIIEFTEQEKDYIMQLYNDERSYNYIAKKIGKCSSKTIARKIKQWLLENNE